MKAIFLNVMQGKLPQLVDVPTNGLYVGTLDFKFIKEKLGCVMLDSAQRSFCGKTYRIFVDDVGVRSCRLGAIGADPNCELYGNLMIFKGENNRGRLTDLTEEDLALFKEHTQIRRLGSWSVLTGIEFPKPKTVKPKALPTIPQQQFVFHVVRQVSKLGKVTWGVRRVRYASYVLRLRHHGDDGLYFASDVVARDVAEVKQKYEKDVQIHVPKAVQG